MTTTSTDFRLNHFAFGRVGGWPQRRSKAEPDWSGKSVAVVTCDGTLDAYLIGDDDREAFLRWARGLRAWQDADDKFVADVRFEDASLWQD